MHASRFERPAPGSALRVGAANDHRERAADRVARAVTGGHPGHHPSRHPGERAGQDREHRPASGPTGGPLDAATARAVTLARSGGRPVPDGIRGRMERATGADLGAVRVHADPTADRLNDRLGSRAFTAGTDVFVRPGAYRPGTAGGDALLAHELTHTVQQAAVAGGATVVQRYQERRDPRGGRWRISDDDEAALLVERSTGGQQLYASDALLAEANQDLADAGSFVRLDTDGHKVKWGTRRARVRPRFVGTANVANDYQEMITANRQRRRLRWWRPRTFEMYADCGRSARTVMGYEGDDPYARYAAGPKKRTSQRGTDPTEWTDDAYRRAMTGFVADHANLRYFRKSHRAQVAAPADGDEAKELWGWLTRPDGRRAFDEYAGINTAARPRAGEGYTMATGDDLPGWKQPDGNVWNFHWAGVVMRSGDDTVTLENYAISFHPRPGETPEQADERSYAHTNKRWVFQMYGLAKGQTFHEQHLATGTHGNRATTFRVRI